MKRFLLLLIAMVFPLLGMSSCSGDEDDTRFVALIKTTDRFIDKLDSVYEHYDALGKESTKTSDRRFQVTPLGRLIIVKKLEAADDVTYSELEDVLSSYYKGHRKVNDVFKNNGGTITIDCRK